MHPYLNVQIENIKAQFLKTEVIIKKKKYTLKNIKNMNNLTTAEQVSPKTKRSRF